MNLLKRYRSTIPKDITPEASVYLIANLNTETLCGELTANDILKMARSIERDPVLNKFGHTIEYMNGIPSKRIKEFDGFKVNKNYSMKGGYFYELPELYIWLQICIDFIRLNHINLRYFFENEVEYYKRCLNLSQETTHFNLEFVLDKL